MGWDILVYWIFDITVIYWNGWWWYFVLSASLNWKMKSCVLHVYRIYVDFEMKYPTHSSRIAFNTSCTNASNFFNQVHQHKIKMHPIIHFHFISFQNGNKGIHIMAQATRNCDYIFFFFTFFYSDQLNMWCTGATNKHFWLHLLFLLPGMCCKPSHSGVWAKAAVWTSTYTRNFVYDSLIAFSAVFPLGWSCSSGGECSPACKSKAQSAPCQEVSMCLPTPEGLFRLKYITIHLCTVMSRGNVCLMSTYGVSQALGKYTFIEHNKSIIFKTIIENNPKCLCEVICQ